MYYEDDLMNIRICNKPKDLLTKPMPKSNFQFFNKAFTILEPTNKLKQKCIDFMTRLKEKLMKEGANAED